MIHQFNAVRRPSRYINRELNSVHRADAAFSFCLAFPDTYEVGMSHLGLKILYGLINSMPGIRAERCFAPWIDYEALLRRTKQPLCSLESSRPLSGFEVVGFSLQYDLSFTNFINMLDLGGIPPLREDRLSGSHPVILAGGPCCVNPAPLSRFVDAFLIGDGEEAVPEIIRAISPIANAPRDEKMAALAGIPGVYVPEIHGEKPQPPVRRRVVDDLDGAYFPTSPVVAHNAVHNRVALEIGRGCPRGCRFCQAGFIYRPLRERSLSTVLRLAAESLENTGYSDISFTSLSAGDYACLPELIKCANRLFKDRHVALSLPSIRVGSLDRDMLRGMKSERKTGYTIAPEAGTERLRHVINKTISSENYSEGLRALFEEGWETVKLYFMIGLPTETDDDVQGIISMAKEARNIAKNVGARRVNINVGVSTFVPKPHTPFQWLGQIPLDEIMRRQEILREGLRSRVFRFKFHQPEMSMLEAMFSRGDGDLGSLLLTAFRKGCRFDGWSEAFDFRLWQDAMEETGIGPDRASDERPMDGPLPWDMVDSGVTAKFLKQEWGRAMKGRVSPECRETCTGCGIGCGKLALAEDKAAGEIPSGPAGAMKRVILPAPTRFRVQYSKTGPLRFLSHLELKETIIRAVRKAGIMPDYSRGFHPHPKIAFGPALGTGISGMAEYFDMDVVSPLESGAALTRLNASLPEGISVENIRPAGQGAMSLDRFVTRYMYRVVLPEYLLHRKLHLQDEIMVQRETGKKNLRIKTVNIRPLVEEAIMENGALLLTVRDHGDTRVRIMEVLSLLLELEEDELPLLEIERTGLFGFRNGWLTPMEALDAV